MVVWKTPDRKATSVCISLVIVVDSNATIDRQDIDESQGIEKSKSILYFPSLSSKDKIK